MAQMREIRTKIASIKGTQKITGAMELVAASKMRKSKLRMQATKPYATKIREVIGHVAAAHSEYNHPYLVGREHVDRVGFIVVSSDRGLCGGLNVNLFRQLMTHVKTWGEASVEIDYCLIGRKAIQFFKRYGGQVVASAERLGDKPQIQDLIGVVKVMLERYRTGELDRLYIAGNQFVNTMTQRPFVRQLLPLEPDAQVSKGHWDYIYEPDSAPKLLDMLLIRYLEMQVYQAVIENNACFQAAQMVAMKSATDNAGDLIKAFSMIYNKARQATITQEIAEIVGGADAIE